MKSRVIRSAADMADFLIHRRLELGWSQATLDDVAGFQDGYASKIEKPDTRYGRQPFRIYPMLTLWLEALGCELVIRKKGAAEAGGDDDDGGQPAVVLAPGPIPEARPKTIPKKRRRKRAKTRRKTGVLEAA